MYICTCTNTASDQKKKDFCSTLNTHLIQKMLCHSFSSLKLFLDGRVYFLDKTSIYLLIGVFFFSPDFSIIMFSVCETIKPMSNGFWVTYGLNHHEQEMIYVEKERLIP